MDGGSIVALRGRESEPAVTELLALAQIHRDPADAASRGLKIAAEYTASSELQLYGYEIGGKVAGVIGVEPSVAASAVVRDLAVTPRYRRSGIGRALIAYIRERFDVLEGDTLEPAVDFYRACGFKVSENGAMPDGASRYRFTWRR